MLPKVIHTEMSGFVDKFTWLIWAIGCFSVNFFTIIEVFLALRSIKQ